jgi:hypothetical protein
MSCRCDLRRYRGSKMKRGNEFEFISSFHFETELEAASLKPPKKKAASLFLEF